MTENGPEEMTNERPEDEANNITSRFPWASKWLILLAVYLLLLGTTGYVAFFQEQFNPAVGIDEQIQAMIDNPDTREFTLEALRSEGEAFSGRRELATQSFNIVLGALLGFLSAMVVQISRRR